MMDSSFASDIRIIGGPQDDDADLFNTICIGSSLTVRDICCDQ